MKRLRTRATLSAAEARRLALAAQGFAEARPGLTPDWRGLRRVVKRLGLLQIDSVNVLVRAHYLPLFSRLGPYERSHFDARAYRRGASGLFEYWAHEASLIPVEYQPLLRWRMARRHDGKWAIEYLFWAGRVAAVSRSNSFERAYDMPERVLPRQVLAMATPPEADAQRALVQIAAQALGVATARDLRDYFRMSPHDGRRAIDTLVESGDLLPVTVAGWRDQAYLAARARIPRQIAAAALLVPFDPLIWERARTERLFGFRYRIEIYTPASQRVHGYYVLPFLLGDRLVARVDLKADRANATLRVHAAHGETDIDRGAVAEALSRELHLLASWLGLDRVSIGRRGDLAGALRGALSLAS